MLKDPPIRKKPSDHTRLGRKNPNSTPLRRVLLLVGMSVPLILAAIAGAVVLFPHWASHADNAANPNCSLIVPPNPLSAQGLATPYELMATDPAKGPCNEGNAAQAAFVQGAVIDPVTGTISIYNPLVIDQGTKPAAT